MVEESFTEEWCKYNKNNFCWHLILCNIPSKLLLFLEYQTILLVSFLFVTRDFKIQRRGRRRGRQKNNRFYKQNNSFARASNFFCTFLSCFCTTTTWKCLLSCFMEDVNKQRRNFISLSELGYGPLKFSFRRVRLHLTK